MTHRFNPTILREYDIRGIVGDTLTEADAYALGRTYAALARDEGAQRIAVGRDGRTHSGALEAQLVRGLTEGGVDAVMWRISRPQIAQQHRLNAGVIVEQPLLTVRFRNGRKLGTIEEGYASTLAPGDHFYFSGLSLEVEQFKDTDIVVRASSKTARIVTYGGQRMKARTIILAGIALSLFSAAATAEPIDPKVQARIDRILKRTPLIDGHNDIAEQLSENYKRSISGLAAGTDQRQPNPLMTDMPGSRRRKST